MKILTTARSGRGRRGTSSLLRYEIRLHSDGFLTDHLGGDGFQKKTTTVQGEVPGAGCSSYMGICKPSKASSRRLDIKVYAPQHARTR